MALVIANGNRTQCTIIILYFVPELWSIFDVFGILHKIGVLKVDFVPEKAVEGHMCH